MKLTIAKEAMLNGLQTVQNIVGTRTTLPILSNVLMRAAEQRLELTATDLDVTISCVVEAKVSVSGAVTLPVKKLFSIVRELGPMEAELEVDDKCVCRLEAGGSLFKLHGLAAEEFPPLPQLGERVPIVLPQEKVRGMLRRTSFAVSVDEARYVLNGLFFSLKEHKVTVVATDGRRLALTDEEVEIDPATQAEIIVPTEAINELVRLLQDKGDVHLVCTQSQAAFHLKGEGGAGALVVSKLVDGTYPNYRQVIPLESRERIPMPREELLQCLRRAELMTSDKSNSVKLAFGRNNLAITSNTPEVGEARETMAINYKGPELGIAFNPAFLIDALKALDNDEVFQGSVRHSIPGILHRRAQSLGQR